MNYTFSDRVNTLKPSAIREIFKYAADPEVVSLSAGNPAPDAFPAEAVAEISAKLLKENPVLALQYGLTEGYVPLRDALKKYMVEKYNVNMEGNDLIITSGAQQVMDLVTKSLVNEGDVVITEAPSFIGSLNTFRSYNAKLVGVKMDDDGMNMEELEKALKENENIRFIYTIPNFQNPAGVTMSLEKRKRLYALAKEYGVLIVEDNPYGELRFSGEDVPTIKSLDKNGNVVYIGSFSKVFSPGLRLAYMVFDKKFREKLVVGKQATDVHTNIFAQMIAQRYLKEYDIDASIQKACEIYKKRCHLMLDCMDKCFPKSVTYTRPDGGIFIWVTLPEGADTLALMQEAVEKKVAFVPGNTFMTDILKPCNSFRLNYSTMPDEKIINGIEILGNLLKSKF